MAETMEMTETRQYKLREVRIRLEEGRSLLSAVPMSDLEAAMEVMRRELSGYDREVLCVVNLNSRLQPINFHVVSVGDLSQSIASIPNILKTGILSNAQSFMLLHNHPSGDVTPSQVDIQMTKRVLEAGKILGIGCVDHIIVGGGNETYFSMREQGISACGSRKPWILQTRPSPWRRRISSASERKQKIQQEEVNIWQKEIKENKWIRQRPVSRLRRLRVFRAK